MSLAVLEAAGWEKPCLLTPAADLNGALGQAGAAVVVPFFVGPLAYAGPRFGLVALLGGAVAAARVPRGATTITTTATTTRQPARP